MSSNELLVLVETIVLIIGAIYSIFRIKDEKKSINGNDLFEIFVSNKDLLKQIIDDLADVKLQTKSESKIKTIINNKLIEIINNETLPLTEFQRTLIKTNKDFFIDYLYDRIVTKHEEKYKTVDNNIDEKESETAKQLQKPTVENVGTYDELIIPREVKEKKTE